MIRSPFLPRLGQVGYRLDSPRMPGFFASQSCLTRAGSIGGPPAETERSTAVEADRASTSERAELGRAGRDRSPTRVTVSDVTLSRTPPPITLALVLGLAADLLGRPFPRLVWKIDTCQVHPIQNLTSLHLRHHLYIDCSLVQTAD